jgi:hypothetical protein
MSSDPDTTARATGSLVGDALAQISRLIRGEVALARAEVEENIRAAAAGLGMVVAGLVVALTALNVLAAALVAALTELGLDGGWAALIVGVALAALAAVMATAGARKLSPGALAPSRTADNLRRDAETIKEGTTHDKHE